MQDEVTTETETAATATATATSAPTTGEIGTLIAGRYRLVRELGRGGFAVTWQAEDLTTHAAVAVKILSLRAVDHWKAVELFEREARVLKNLDHPQIPKYLDFIAPSEGSDMFVLVQALAPGKSLADLVKGGWRPTESEARELADQVLAILEHLHGRSPPVVHRDIKPANLVRGPDGRISLIDFGSVRDRLASTSEYASTAGTFGYMAPEQLTGRATPASDLYGLGATLLYVLSHRQPGDLPQRELRIDFSGAISVSRGFERFLGRLLAPAPEQRFASAQAARATLAGGLVDRSPRLGSFAAERIAATVEPDAVLVDIAPLPRWFLVIATLAMLAATLAIVGSVFSDADASIFRLFWGAVTGIMTWRIGRRAGRSFTSTHLRFDADGTTIARRIGKLGVGSRHIKRGEPMKLASLGYFKKRDLVMHTRGATEQLGVKLDRDAIAGIEARIRQLDSDLHG